MRRGCSLFAATAVLAAVVAGCSSARSGSAPAGSASSRSAGPSPTVQHVVTPISVQPVTRTVTGSCFTTSVADPGRTDAYRCLGGNLLLDPCLPEQPTAAAGTALICPNTPEGPSIRVRTRGPLPAGLPAPPGPSAWVVRTQDGLTCTSIGGGTAMPLAGDVATFRCGSRGRDGSLIGALSGTTSADSGSAGADVLSARFAPPGATAPSQVRVVRLTDTWG